MVYYDFWVMKSGGKEKSSRADSPDRRFARSPSLHLRWKEGIRKRKYDINKKTLPSLHRR